MYAIRSYYARDMAILVRTKAEAKVIADCLLTEKATGTGDYNFNVLSGESLYVKNAASVAFLVSMLRLLKDPDDELSLSFANYQYYATIAPVLLQLNKQVDWAVEQEDVAQLQMDFAPRYRITSYNVCYTKLLRASNELIEAKINFKLKETEYLRVTAQLLSVATAE